MSVRRVRVDGEVHLVCARSKPLIERLVEQRDRARAEVREGRQRVLHWRCGPTKNESLEDFNVAP